MPILSGSNLGLYYGDFEVFSNVSLEVNDDARIGIVGPNGGGKTSLLNVLLRELEPTTGSVTRARGTRIGYVPQHPPSGEDGETLRDVVSGAFSEVLRIEGEITETERAIEESADGQRQEAESRYASLLEQYESLGGYEYHNLVTRATAGVGLTAANLETPTASASGGERTRAALAKALLSDPDLLVLDEPTNYLDFGALAWLETTLSRSRHAFVVVSHDRYFLDRVANQIWDVDNHRLETYPGNYSKYRVLREEQRRRQQKEYEAQQDFIAKEESFIQRYHAGQRGREARGRATRLERVDRLESVSKERAASLQNVSASRTGQVVLTTRGLRVGYDDGGSQVQLLTMPDTQVQRESRTAIVGSNGSGKTTLLRTITGQIPALEGTANTGYNVEVGYYRQDLTDLPNTGTVLDALLDIKNLPIGEARAYLARFLFRGEDAFKEMSMLSGGERSRLALARLLIQEPNVLILDEPTTHLDIPSREALEQVLLSYNGTLLFVSHDRQLISLLAQQLWNVREGGVEPFSGTFEEWQEAEARAARNTGSASEQRRSQQQRARTQSKNQAPKPWIAQLEREIPALEQRLKQVERDLETASRRQDVEGVALLGQEYNDVRRLIDEAWEKWGDG